MYTSRTKEGSALTTVQRYNYLFSVDVRAASAKLKELRNLLNFADEVSLSFERKVKKRGPSTAYISLAVLLT